MQCCRMSKQNQLFALVRWRTGVDKGRYTPGVPIEWIMDFKYDDFLKNCDEDDDESYVIQWHDTKKEPLGGWKCYDGQVIQVSDRKAELERIFRLIQGVASPNLKITNFDDPDKSLDSHIAQNSEILQNTPLTSQRKKATDKPDSSPNSVESPIKKKKRSRCKGNELQSSSSEDEPPEKKSKESCTLQKAKEEDDAKIKKSNPQTRNLRKDNEELPSAVTFFTDTLLSIQARLDQLAEKENVATNTNRASTALQSDREKVTEEKNQDIEIGQKGSGIILKKGQLDEAVSRPTPTSMATALVDSIFHINVLLVSNLKGGAAKTKPKAGKEYERRKVLDKKKVKAIYDEVEKKFPGKFSRASLGSAINNHLNRLRSQKAMNDELEQKEQQLLEAAEKAKNSK